jgi:hypothetical protein
VIFVVLVALGALVFVLVVVRCCLLVPLHLLILPPSHHALPSSHSLKLDTITTADVIAALSCTKPSAKTLQDKYLSWQKEYASIIS